MSVFQIEVERRDLGVKNSFKKSKQENYIPCVLYNGKENYSVKVKRDDFEKKFKNAKNNTVYEFSLDGKSKKAFVKDIDFFLGKEREIVHIDFYGIDAKSTVKIKVPFEYTGVPEGVKIGGHVEFYQKSFLVECKGNDIPDVIRHDISSFDLGQRLYLRDIQKTQKYKLLDAEDNCLLAVVMSKKSVSLKSQEGEDSSKEKTVAG